MAKYKDSFQMNTESLEKGGRGILTAVENKNPNQKQTHAPAPKFDKPKTSSKISPIRTLADDMQRASQKERVSLASQALKHTTSKGSAGPSTQTPTENVPRKPPQAHKTTRSTKTTRRSFPVGALLIALTLAVFGGSAYVFVTTQGISLGSFSLPQLSFSFPFSGRSNTEPETTPEQPDTLTTVNATAEITLTGEAARSDLLAGIEKAKEEIPPENILALLPVETVPGEGDTQDQKATITAGELFEIINPSVDSALIRNAEDYTLGIVSASGRAETYLTIELRSYEESFAAMLDWEEDMARDLYGFFHNNQLATLSNSLSFRDTSISYSDTRFLEVTTEEVEITGDTESRSESAEDILSYSFPDKNTLIITESRDSLRALLSHLR